jgi:hypothetical protein
MYREMIENRSYDHSDAQPISSVIFPDYAGNMSSSSNSSSLPPSSSIDTTDTSGSGSTMTMDVLAAVFFVVAASWLVLATLYAALVYMYLRLRARQRLDRIYEPDFGQVTLCGRYTVTLPLACLLRRYVRHLHGRVEGAATRGPLILREERRRAMEALLEKGYYSNAPATTTPDIDVDVERADNASTEEEGPMCSICLGDYEEDDVVFQASTTCSHQFHKECILDWLERRENTECPCCRVPMVEEEDVWKTVELLRKQNRRKRRTKKKDKNVVEATGSTESDETPVNDNESQVEAAAMDDDDDDDEESQAEKTEDEEAVTVNLPSIHTGAPSSNELNEDTEETTTPC